MNTLGFVIFSSILVATLAVDCSTLADGVYDVGCKSFARCTGAVAKIVDCENGTVYNNKTGSCDDPKNVAPPCGQMRDCSNQKDGKYSDNDFQCHSYYTCYKGKFLGHNPCPGTLVFNQELQTCDWMENVPPPCGNKSP